MIPIKITVQDNSLGVRFKRKGSEIPRKIEEDANRMLNLIKGTVQRVTPRGRGGCTGKGGNMRSAITIKNRADGGEVYVDEKVAPYVKWVIPGRGPVHAKGKKNGGADFLHFCIAGRHIFVKSVRGVKPNDFIKTALPMAKLDVTREGAKLGEWLRSI